MMLEKNWTVRTRIVLSFVGILTTIVISASLAYVRLLRIETLTDGISANILPTLTVGGDIVVERLVNYSRTLEYAYEPDRSQREAIQKAITSGRASIDALLGGYRPTIGDPEEQQLPAVYQRARADYRIAPDLILTAGLDGSASREDLVRRLTAEVRPKFEQAQAEADVWRSTTSLIS